jgi:2-C-methyl-D-erythritol 2,4-cyclodiphosphate synthase
MRIGIGHDTHRLGEGGPLRLGGLTVSYDRHLIGHSDADVLLHAITDALLGALALGDIGELFPDTDPRHRGQDSKVFLLEALRQVRERGFRVANLDCIVFAERPKLLPYRDPIRRQLASWLEVDVSQVSVKAKTGETVGPVGREEALAAQAVVLLSPAGAGD